MKQIITPKEALIEKTIDATDLLSAIALLNDLKAKYNDLAYKFKELSTNIRIAQQ